MTEPSVQTQLCHLLFREDGASRSEITSILNIPSWRVTALLQEVGLRISPLGLQLRYNPLTRSWYAVKEANISESIGETTLPDRLAATLFFLLKFRFSEERFPTIEELSALRQKSKSGVRQDLRDLEKRGLVVRGDATLQLGPKLVLFLPSLTEDHFVK